MEQKLLRTAFLFTLFVYVAFNITSTVSHCWMQTVPVENSTTYKETKQGLFMQCVEGKILLLKQKKFDELYRTNRPTS